MTTRIHIVNFGPDKVEVHIPQQINTLAETIWPNQYKDFWVYDNHEVVVREVKEVKKDENDIPF